MHIFQRADICFSCADVIFSALRCVLFNWFLLKCIEIHNAPDAAHCGTAHPLHSCSAEAKDAVG